MTSADRSPAALRARFYAELAPEARSAVAAIVELPHGPQVYLACGAARDLVLGRPITDVDLALEGDAIDTVRRALPGTRITAHQRFRTATVIADRSHIDVVTARSETYDRPGALPRIRPADIATDMRRRDFSVNAIALRLSGEAAWIDPCGGIADLDRRLIQALHERSFIDDPTRIYRAIRFACRFGFTIEPATARWMSDGLGHVQALSGARLRRELERMLQEGEAGRALELAARRGALRAAHAALAWDGARSDGFALHADAHVPRLPLGFALLASRAKPDEAAAIVDHLRLRREEAAAVTAIASMRDLSRTLRRPDAKPSGVVVLLDRYPAVAVAAFAATTDDAIARQLALRYLDEWRHVKPQLRGDDLIALGVPEGPQVHRGLQLIRAARLDGWAGDEGDERALALRFAKSIRDSKAANAEIELHVNGH
jgi:tRNA nucleotidyltransferase (CCA-adding enzyme)